MEQNIIIIREVTIETTIELIETPFGILVSVEETVEETVIAAAI